MTNGAADKHLARMNSAVRKAHSRFYRTGEKCDLTGHAVETRTPLDELIDREEEAERDAAMDGIEAAQQMLGFDVLPEPLVALVKAAALDHFRQYEATLIEWLFADGPHLIDVARRLFLYVKKKNASLIWNMGYRELGKMFDVEHETLRIQAKLLFGDLPGGAVKTAEARQAMKESAMGNQNRRGGKKVAHLNGKARH